MRRPTGAPMRPAGAAGGSDFAAVAAPVPGPGGLVRAALGVSVSRAEFGARRWELEVAVRAAAARVARAEGDEVREAGQL